MTMQACLLLCLILALGHADKSVQSVVEAMNAVSTSCLAESGASETDLAQLLRHQVPDSAPGRCLLFCFHKHFRIQNLDGSFDRDGVVKVLGKVRAVDAEMYEQLVQVAERCGQVAFNEDPCLYAANLANCALVEGNVRMDEVMMVEAE